MKLTHGMVSGVLCILFLTGTASATENNTSLNTLYGGDMNTCLNDLNMLKTFSQSQYDSQSGALNGVIGRATHYLLMRNQLSTDMQGVMDNIWQSRLTAQCQGIHNALFDGLLRQAGGTGGAGVMTGRGAQ